MSLSHVDFVTWEYDRVFGDAKPSGAHPRFPQVWFCSRGPMDTQRSRQTTSAVFPESASEGFLLCRSSAGAELSFPPRCRRVAAALPPKRNLEKET